MKPSMTIIMGPAGSGKSTLAMKLWRENNTGNLMFIYEADMWMMEGNEYKFDPKKLSYCHNQCQENTERALFDGHNVIVSNTTLRRKDLNLYMDIAAKYNAPVKIIKMLTRHKSIHNIPDEKLACMESMFKSFDWKDLPEFVTVENYPNDIPDWWQNSV